MAFSNLLLQAIALIAPAWVIALIFVSLARCVCWRGQWNLSWISNVLANALLGSLCLLLALVLTGEDGTLLSYAGLVLANASLQLALFRGR